MAYYKMYCFNNKTMTSNLTNVSKFLSGLSFHKERIPPFTAGVNPTLADQSTDDTLHRCWRLDIDHL